MAGSLEGRSSAGSPISLPSLPAKPAAVGGAEWQWTFGQGVSRLALPLLRTRAQALQGHLPVSHLGLSS